jgi:TonB family protein
MSKNFSVPNPCDKPWDGMIPKENGRYCDSCQKVVIDFTNKSNQEIIDYINANSGKKLCGTFKKEQLIQTEKEYHDYVIKFVASLLLAFGMTLFSCNGESIDLGDQPHAILTENERFDEITGIMVSPPTQVDSANSIIIEDSAITVSINLETTTGDIYMPDVPPPMIERLDSIAPTCSTTGEAVLGVISQEMPEFENGGQTLQEYIASNLVFPNDSDAQGTVYVSFYVMKDGSITEVKLLKGFDPAFDQEALRVVKSMPKWKPGRDYGQPVNVRFTIPIKFRMK